MPQADELRPPMGRLVTWAAALALLVGVRPAAGYTFSMVNTESEQYLTWHWESGWPYHSCLSAPIPCGNTTSVNGLIDSTNVFSNFGSNGGFQSMRTGGYLRWSGSDSLKVVALSVIAASASLNPVTPSDSYAEAWAAVNARDFPMIFRMDARVGDPAVTSVRITPKLLGSLPLTTSPGGLARATVQFQMSVAVNGVTQSSDAMNQVFEVADGTDQTVTLDFPKGGVNTVVVPGVPSGSEIAVMIWNLPWAYATASGTNSLGSVSVTSPYGPGAAIVVLVEPVGIVGVGDGPASARPTLGVAPNPTSDAARIRYSLPRAASVRLAIYDVAGHRVATLVDRLEGAGHHEVAWAGAGPRGEPLAPGVYLVELSAGADRVASKLAVLDR